MFNWIYKGADSKLDHFLCRKLGQPFILFRRRQILSELRRLDKIAWKSNRNFNKALEAMNEMSMFRWNDLSQKLIMRVMQLKARGFELELSQAEMLAQVTEPTLREVLEVSHATNAT